MKGAYLFSLVLLIVLAIPLFADQALVNPVGESSAISIINSQEVPFSQQEQIDSNVPVLAVGINRKRYLPYMEGSREAVPSEKPYIDKTSNKGYGGGRRVKLGRH